MAKSPPIQQTPNAQVPPPAPKNSSPRRSPLGRLINVGVIVGIVLLTLQVWGTLLVGYIQAAVGNLYALGKKDPTELTSWKQLHDALNLPGSGDGSAWPYLVAGLLILLVCGGGVRLYIAALQWVDNAYWKRFRKELIDVVDSELRAFWEADQDLHPDR